MVVTFLFKENTIVFSQAQIKHVNLQVVMSLNHLAVEKYSNGSAFFDHHRNRTYANFLRLFEEIGQGSEWAVKHGQ